MATSPVNHSFDPLLEGCEPLRLISIASPFAPLAAGQISPTQQRFRMEGLLKKLSRGSVGATGDIAFSLPGRGQASRTPPM